MTEKKGKFAVLLKIGEKQPALDRASQYARFIQDHQCAKVTFSICL